MDKTKSKRENLIVIIGSAIFIIAVIAQAIVSRKFSGSGINGVILQLQILDAVLLTVLAAKKGFIASLILNAINLVYTLVLVVIIMKNYNSIPGTIAPLITIITCCIIYSYSDRISKTSKELQEKNAELTETNRIIREKDEKLIYLAYYDVLTGLANRQLFVEKIDEAIADKSNENFTIVIADIDNFKMIIDSYGHNTGDILLSTYADRLRGYCGNDDFIAKFGEEEYAIILRKSADDEETTEYINKLRSVLCAPVTVNNTPIQLTMSFGVSEYPANGKSSSEILRNTDIAVRNAKMSGRGFIYFLNQQRIL